MLDDVNILILEDEALIAMDVQLMLEERGAQVTGPCATIEEACAHGMDCDAAILDVDIHGSLTLPVADRLSDAGTPFLFHTGRSDLDLLRQRYGADVPIVRKPAPGGELVRVLKDILNHG